MSTKAEIQALIDTKLADTSDITASELREVENAQLNENFVGQVEYTGTVGGLAYVFRFTKKGNYCILTGEITNTTSTITGFGNSFPIPTPFAIPTRTVRFNANKVVGGQVVAMAINPAPTSTISIGGTLSANDIIYFNLTYTINS